MQLTAEQRVLLNRMAILHTWRYLIGPVRSDALACALADLDVLRADNERLRAEVKRLEAERDATERRVLRARAWEYDPGGKD